jgi:hypothetical protein
MNPVIAAGIIGAASAVLSSLMTGLLLINSTRLQIHSAAQVTRQTFISEEQAETYVRLCNQVSRVEAWATVAIDVARGRQSHLDRPSTMTADDWFELQGRLRVFGSRIARDEFDMTMAAAHALQAMETSALQGRLPNENDAISAAQALKLHAARVRTCVSAEIGPLRDLLDPRPIRWWQIRRRMSERKQLDELQSNDEEAGV